MDKIRALLEQLGGSKELVDKIVENFESYRAGVDTKTQDDYHKRLEKAKEACLAEVKSYKTELARKVQIFLESRVEKIEQQVAKQVAVRDSAAESKLQAVAALLEGVQVNGEGNKADLEAAVKQLKDLQEQVQKLSGQNKALTEKANRAHGIAEMTIQRNKVLAKELAEVMNVKPSVSEDKKTKKPITEDRKEAAKPVTTRSQAAQQLAKPRKQEEPEPRIMGGFSPESIAATMNE